MAVKAPSEKVTVPVGALAPPVAAETIAEIVTDWPKVDVGEDEDGVVTFVSSLLTV